MFTDCCRFRHPQYTQSQLPYAELFLLGLSRWDGDKLYTAWCPCCIKFHAGEVEAQCNSKSPFPRFHPLLRSMCGHAREVLCFFFPAHCLIVVDTIVIVFVPGASTVFPAKRCCAALFPYSTQRSLVETQTSLILFIKTTWSGVIGFMPYRFTVDCS